MFVDETDGMIREQLAGARRTPERGRPREHTVDQHASGRAIEGGVGAGGLNSIRRAAGRRRRIACLGALAVVAVLAAGCEFPGQRPAAAPPVAATRSPATAPPPTATAAPTTSQATPTAMPIPGDLRHEIEDAYVRYWQVRADAALTLDPSHLPEVAAGDRLEREREQIAQLQTEGRAAQVSVTLDFRVVRATETSATVNDDLKNFSYAVDLQTRAPLVEPPGVPEIHVVSFELQKIEGVWKVVDGARYEIRRPN